MRETQESSRVGAGDDKASGPDFLNFGTLKRTFSGRTCFRDRETNPMAKPGRVLPSHRRYMLQTAFVLLIVSALVRASPAHDVVPENDFVELPEQVASSMAETQVASGEETNAEATTGAAAAWTAEQAEVKSSKATKESGSPKDQPELSEIKAETKTSTAEIPCMVIAGTRNGARYPEAAKNWPNQAAWPRASSKFWSENAGQLTIQGGEQMERVGAKMASMYPQMFEFVHSLKIFSDSDTLRSATHFLKVPALGDVRTRLTCRVTGSNGRNYSEH